MRTITIFLALFLSVVAQAAGTLFQNYPLKTNAVASSDLFLISDGSSTTRVTCTLDWTNILEKLRSGITNIVLVNPADASFTNLTVTGQLTLAEIVNLLSSGVGTNMQFKVPSVDNAIGFYVGSNSALSTVRIERLSGNGSIQIGGTNWISGGDLTEYVKFIASSKGLTVRPGIGGMELDGGGLRIGYHGSQAPLYPITVGPYYTRSVDPAINVSLYRTNNTGSNWHCFSDSSIIDRADGKAFNSYDARVEVRGTNDYDHYAGFQFLPEFTTTGSVSNLYGFYGGSTVTNTTIGNYYGLYLNSPTLGAGASITGQKWGIYAMGDTHIGGDLEVVSNSTMANLTFSGTLTSGTNVGISTTIDVLTSASSTNRLVFNNGILISNIVDYAP